MNQEADCTQNEDEDWIYLIKNQFHANEDDDQSQPWSKSTKKRVSCKTKMRIEATRDGKALRSQSHVKQRQGLKLCIKQKHQEANVMQNEADDWSCP